MMTSFSLLCPFYIPGNFTKNLLPLPASDSTHTASVLFFGALPHNGQAKSFTGALVLFDPVKNFKILS